MESAVKLARLYRANPLLVVRDLNSMFGSEFGKVFQFRLRESSFIYGPSQWEGYWTVSGEPDQDLDLLTEPQSRYVRRLDHIRRALLLVTRSHPEIFAVLDLLLLDRFLAACRSLQAERPMSETCGVLSNADLRENLRSFAEWIDDKGLGSKDPGKSSNHKDGSESNAILAAPDTELVNNAENPERLLTENKTKTHSPPAIATKPDGPDESRAILVLDGYEFGPFTATQFDIVNIMWANRASKRSASDVFFQLHHKFNWSQHGDSPFGKHQSGIKAAFTGQGYELPWKRGRGQFVWRGLVPCSTKLATKIEVEQLTERKVSRSKKR
jgi:hypothetical protein